MKSFLKYLQESFISPNNGARYGQVIFLVGGAASGKSTAIRKFIDSGSYKILNPDDVKELVKKAAEKGHTAFSDLAGVNPYEPEGAAKFHQKLRDTKISSRYSRRLTSDPHRSELPNLLFDRTFSFAGEIEKISSSLRRAGYDPNNIHIVYVFTDVEVAVQQNRDRERKLKDEIIVSTNKGAKQNFIDLLFQRMRAAPVNGDYFMVTNNKVIKIKEAGKRLDREGEIARKVVSIIGN